MNDTALYNSRVIDMLLAFTRSSYRHVDLDEVLAHAGIQPYQVSDAGHWFTQKQVNLFYEKLVQVTGDKNLARHAGQYSASVESLGFIRKYILGMLGPVNVFNSIKSSSRILTRSAIYDAVKLAENRMEITATPLKGVQEQPYQCENRFGLFEAVVRSFDFDVPKIEHPECIFNGGAACRYIVSWNISPQQRMRKARNYGAAGLVGLGALLYLAGLVPAAGYAVAAGLSILPVLSYAALFLEKHRLDMAFTKLKNSADELVEQIDVNYNNALLVSEIGQAISMHTDMDVVLAGMIQALEKRLSYDRCLIMLSDTKASLLKFRIGFGYTDEQLQLWQRTAFDLADDGDDVLFTKVFREQAPCLINGCSEQGGGVPRPDLALAGQMGVQSLLCCPIVCEGKSLGILAVESLDATRQLVQSDLSLMMGIASVVGTSIRNTAYIEHEKLLSEQLIHSQKLESIGQLSGGLAHDLNNILSVINGFAMLHKMNTDQTPDQARYIEEICAATERAAQLVKSLLAYSRRQAINQKHMELNQLMRNIASFISRIVSENIELDLSLAEQPVIVFVDPVQIEQVMLNLASNARDAMPDGGKLRITVATELIDEVTCTRYEDIKAGSYATILVSDTGTGMHEETRRRIFDPFFTTKKVGKGTGLGLSMSMGIITQHGGFIDVRSTPGTGTDFKLFLPLDGMADVPAETLAAEPDGTPESVSGTILIAEDDPKILGLLKELLTNAGYRIITAMNGQDAVDTFSAGKHDIQLVISDMVMPLKGGKEACIEIRRIDGTVKFIFISGYPQDTVRCCEAFGDDADVIVKPVKALDLLAMVKKHMDACETGLRGRQAGHEYQGGC